MAEKKSINTRLLIRNADLSAWENSEVVLLKGEMALARLSGDQDGCYKVRIGVGDKTWSQLSDQGQLIIPASNVEGLTTQIAALSTSYYECSAISELSGQYVNGDIAVEKKTINGDLEEYCAYRYSTKVSAWQALDGNYSADNVYFSKDITLAGSYSSVGNIQLTAGTLAAAGKSVKTVMENIFTKELSGSYTKPKYTFSTTSNNNGHEVGETYTVPAATFTYNSSGSYTYSPTNAACQVLAGYVTIERTTTGETTSSTNASEITVGKTFSCSTGSTGIKYSDSSVSYQFKLSAQHTQGVMPKTNLGNDIPAYQIAAGDNWTSDSSSKTITATYRGYRKCFWGYRTVAEGALDVENLTSKNIREDIHAVTTNSNDGGTKESLKSSFTIPASVKQVIFAVPHGSTSKTTIDLENTATGRCNFDNDNKKVTGKLTVEGYGGYTAMDYDFWYVTFPAQHAAKADYSITYS